MHRLLITTFLLVTSFISQSSPATNMSVLADFSVSAGYTENLLNDSSDVGDSFSSYSGNVRLYPLPSLELNGNTNYRYYSDFYNLSSLTGGLGFVYIPTSDESPFSVYISANFSGLRYREEFEAFDNNDFDATVSAGYRLNPRLALRTGLVWRSTSYLYSNSGDKENWEAFTGMNITPFGRNSFDLEIGYGSAIYNYIPVSSWSPPWDFYFDFNNPEGLLVGGSLKSFYVAPRFSRPLGFKTGLNITYMYRTFMNTEDGIVYGTSFGLLSPWTSIWEGHSVAVNFKSFIIPTVMLTAGVGYWEKTFLGTLEGSDYPVIIPTEHADEQSKFYIQMQRPVSTPLGVLQPNIRIDYVDNESTNDLYDYYGFSLSAGVGYQL